MTRCVFERFKFDNEIAGEHFTPRDATRLMVDLLSADEDHTTMADYFFSDDRVKSQLIKLFGELVHENVRAEAG